MNPNPYQSPEHSDEEGQERPRHYPPTLGETALILCFGVAFTLHIGLWLAAIAFTVAMVKLVFLTGVK